MILPNFLQGESLITSQVNGLLADAGTHFINR